MPCLKLGDNRPIVYPILEETMAYVENVSQLQAVYGEPGEPSLVKEIPQLIPHYAEFIQASPFVMMATFGEEGMDCSPRGDFPGFVRVADERTLLMPDRRGNNRIDSLRNIVETGKIALCFMVPGSRNCLRVNGRAKISLEAELKASFSVKGKEPRSVLVIKTEAVYFQCGRAIVRSKLWDSASQVDPATLPTPGQILQYLSDQVIDGAQYDAAWDQRAAETLW